MNKFIYFFEKAITLALGAVIRFLWKHNDFIFHRSTYESFRKSKILLDLDYIHAHLGDRLFFIILAKNLLFNNRLRLLNGPTYKLYKCFGIEVDDIIIHRNSSSDVLTVTTLPCLLRFLFHNRKLPDAIVDFTVIETDLICGLQRFFFGCYLPKSYHLTEFTKFIRKNLDPIKLRIPNSSVISKKVVFFSNYLASGFFRKYFIDESILSNTAITFYHQGYSVIHLGSIQNTVHDSNYYPFVTHDFRGKFSISDLIALIAASEDSVFIGYDNFWLHTSNIFRLRPIILFRGRFSRSAQHRHYSFINNAFSLVNLEYLNESKNY